MAIRRPNGIPDGGSVVEEPDEGPALARSAVGAADMDQANAPGEAFPSGMQALAILEGRGATQATICNLSLKRIGIDRTHGPQPAGKKGVVKTWLKPFETVTVPLDEAKRIMAHQELAPAARPGKRSKRPLPILVAVGVFEGNCRGKRSFSVTVRGQGGRTARKTFHTCPFHGCPHADHSDHPFSVSQAQHFMRTLRTPEAIARLAEFYDLRTDVTAMAHFESERRRELDRIERMEAARGAAAAEAVN